MLATLVLAAALVVSPERPVVRANAEPAPGRAGRPSVAAGTSGYFVVWPYDSRHILGASFDAEGRLLATNHYMGEGSSADVTANGETYVVARTAIGSIEITEIDAGGRVQRNATIDRARPQLRGVRVVRTRSGYTVAWIESLDRTQQFAPGPVVIATLDEALRPVRAPAVIRETAADFRIATNGTSVLVATQWNDVRFALVSEAGNVFGRSVAEARDSTLYDAASDGESYALLYRRNGQPEDQTAVSDLVKISARGVIEEHVSPCVVVGALVARLERITVRGGRSGGTVLRERVRPHL